MKRFVIHKMKDSFSIVEVEFEYVKASEDVTVMWLKPGEWKGRVLKPNFLFEKGNPPTYYSWSFFHAPSLALKELAFRYSANNKRTEEEIVNFLNSVNVIYL